MTDGSLLHSSGVLDLKRAAFRSSQVPKDLPSSPRTPFSVVSSGEYLADLGRSFSSRGLYDEKTLG